MRTVTYRLVDLQRSPVIAIGFVGENEHTRILFDCLKIFEEYPDSIPSLTVRPPAGDTYPGIVVRDGDMVIWDIMNSDLIVEGYGELQLTFTLDNVVVKTYIARTKILRSLLPVGEIPTPIADWILRANTVLGEIPATIEASADAALEAAKESGDFDGVGIVKIEKTGSSGLIDTYTILLTDGNTYEFTVTNGEDGEDGFSPVVTVTEITGGHRVVITDASGPHPFDVMDGKSGDVIDDDAGAGATDKTWSADKLTSELSNKADKTDTVLNTTLSRGRKANSTVGTGSFAFGDVVAASGHYSHAEGVGSSSDIQYGYNHLKNDNSIGRITFSGSPGAKGYGSHAEGYASLPYDSFAHAEGYATYAGGYASHAEGNSTYASGVDSHAEGYQTTANGQNSHAEGSGTIASDVDAHAEGTSTVASHPGAHAEGYRTRALDDHTHSEGESTIANNNAAHAEGSGTYAGGYAAHAEGGRFASGDTKAIDGQVYRYGATGGYSHSEGTDTISYGQNSHAEGSGTSAIGEASHTEGAGTKATSTNAHAEGASTTASGTQAHAEGAATTASGVQSHAEGVSTTASGTQAHAEGSGTRATNASAHSEGSGTEASGLYSHAEGGGTHATGGGSHSEGASTHANGDLSHAEGNSTYANGTASHAEGYNTVANAQYSHVSGRDNIPDDYTKWAEWTANTAYAVGDKVKRTTTQNSETVVKGYICKIANSDSSFNSSKWDEDFCINYAVIVGNGKYNDPSNAYSLDWDGNGHFKGDVYVGCNADGTGGTKLSIPEIATTSETQAIITEYGVSA